MASPRSAGHYTDSRVRVASYRGDGMSRSGYKIVDDRLGEINTRLDRVAIARHERQTAAASGHVEDAGTRDICCLPWAE